MKERRSSATLSIVLAVLLTVLLAFIHVVAQLTDVSLTVTPFFTKFLVDPFVSLFNLVVNPVVSITYIGTVAVLAIALVLVIVWVIRLLVNRRNALNLFSPLLFLLSVLVGLFTVIHSRALQTAYATAKTQIASVYLLLIIIAIIAVAVHLLVIGLADSGRKKTESLLKETPLVADEEDEEDDEDEEDEEDEIVEDKGEEVEEEEVEEEIEEVVEEEAVEEEAVEEEAKPINYADPELLAAIRKVVREELDARPPVIEKIVVQKIVEEHVEVAPAKEEAKKPFPPVRKKAEPVEEVKKPEPKKPIPAPVVVAPVRVFDEEDADGAAERVPFAERLKLAEDSVQVNYNVVKNYLMSYDVKSRLSHSGDSFRLGRKLLAKITTSGKSGLKIYLPLKLSDYSDTKLPLKDASHIKQYEDVPVMLYIKSDLSVKRAQQLIDDVMIANSLARKYEREDQDYVAEL